MGLSNIAVHVRNAAVNAAAALLQDSGEWAATVKIYTTGKTTLLGTVTLQKPAFGSAVNGIAYANTPLTRDESADNTGTAAVYAQLDNNGITLWEGTIGASGSGADMIMPSTSIVSGQPVEISSYELSMSAS